MNRKFIRTVALVLLFSACQNEKDKAPSLFSQLEDEAFISGNPEYLNSPYATTGNRVYMIGHQNGTFPDLGWHIQGEMGGIWLHPIKLMDGFTAQIAYGDQTFCLDSALSFRQYWFANQQLYQHHNLTFYQSQYVPDSIDGIIVEYAIENTGQEKQEFTFKWTPHFDLRPVWLGERTGMIDHEDTLWWDQNTQNLVAKDLNNDWYAIVSSNINLQNQNENPCNFSSKGSGVHSTLSTSLIIEGNSTEHIKFYITGSYQSEKNATNQLEKLRDKAITSYEEKMSRYNAVRTTAQLDIPDSAVQTLYDWTKFNVDWLIREVPETGRGIGAGLPDYPWWFGADHAYTLLGAIPSGRHELARDVLQLMFMLSEKTNGNGRIIHEASTNAAVFNPGTVQETPLMIMAAWEYLKWTGDSTFISQHYDFLKEGMEWTLEQDQDGNGYPDGFGIMEIHGLDGEMIDVAVYTQQALEAMSALANFMNEGELANQYQKQAIQLKHMINSEWWVERAGSFADFRANKTKTMELLEAAIVRADTLDKPWSKNELIQYERELEKAPDKLTGHAFFHNWVVNTPMETGIADSSKAFQALETAKKYGNPFGVYVTGIDRKSNEEVAEGLAAKKQKESFNYVGAVMTLPTGVQAMAEIQYGRPDEALNYLHMLHRSFSYAAPGSMYEVSPDYGMLVQAWNIYGVARPVINGFFGIQPMAHLEQIIIDPAMPQSWDNATLSNVPIGNNRLTINKRGETYTISQHLDFTILIPITAFGLPDDIDTGTVEMNGTTYYAIKEKSFTISKKQL